MQGNHRKAVIYVTLREKAQEWLKNYKGAGNAYGGNILSLEEMAAIVSEYLYETDPRKKAEDTSERIKVLQDELSKTEQMLEGERMTHESLVYDLARARAKVEAYEFVIRCNSMSGAEVRQ